MLNASDLWSVGRRILVVAMILLGAGTESFGADTYANGLLFIPSVTIGTKVYADMIVTVEGYNYGLPETVAGGDTYDPASNQLASPAITVGDTTYTSVSVAISGLVTVGSVAGGDVYDGHALTLASVAVAGVSNTNVGVTVGDVVAVSGGMPAAGEDQYDPVSQRLSLPAVVAGGRVFTNVVVTVAQVVSIGGSVAVPALSQVLPGAVVAGTSGVQLTAYGTGFTASSIVRWNGSALPTNYVSATLLTAQVPATDLLTPGLASIDVVTMTVGGTSSGAQNLTVNREPEPVITSLSPNILDSGAAAFSLAVAGANFTPGAVVQWNGSARATTYASATQLLANITPQDVAVSGSASVTVVDPAAGNTPSNGLTFTIAALIAPSLTMLSPNAVPAGNPAFRLTVIGAGFVPGSQVNLNGLPLATISQSASVITAVVPASAVAATGIVEVAVVNPAIQGGASQPLALSIVASSIDAVSYQINAGHTGAVNFRSVTLPSAVSWSRDLGSQPSYALIVGGIVYVAGSNGNVVALDARTGTTVWGPLAYTGYPGLGYDGGILFVTSGATSIPALLTAVDPRSGNPLWTVQVPSAEFDTVSYPVAMQGLVFVLNDREVTAFRGSDGAALWTQRFFSSYGAVAATIDGVYAMAGCAFDFQPATGATLWSTSNDCGDGGSNTPTVGSGLMFAPISGILDGNVYTQEAGGLVGSYLATAQPAVSATTAFVLQNSTLQATSLSTRQVLWSFSGDGQLVTAPIVVNDYVFIGSAAGNLYALDAAAGTQLGVLNLGAPIPPAANGPNGGFGAPGLSAGDGLLIVPAGNTVNAFVLSANP